MLISIRSSISVIFIVFLVSIFCYLNNSYATGGAFTSTKHGGGTTDGLIPLDVGNGPGVDRSINPDYGIYYNEFGEAGKYMGGECTQCHEPHASFGEIEPLPNIGGDTGPDAYLALKDYGSTVSYAELCWYCHENMSNINGSGSPLTSGRWSFYQGKTVYQQSSHYTATANMYWPGTFADIVPIWPRRQNRDLLPPGNNGSCLNCHTPHGIKASGPSTAYDTTSEDLTGGVPAFMQTVASGNPSVNADYLIPRQLIAWEETLCERCHDSNPAINIQREINKRHFSGQSGHPVDDTGLAGRHVASESLPITIKHVECYDCHNPHAINASNRLEGMKYIDINGVIRDPALGARQPYVYEVCLKCHGDSFDCIMPHIAYGAETMQAGCVDGPPRDRGLEIAGTGFNYQWGSSNKRKEFDPTTPHTGAGQNFNTAFHPVAAPGRNRSIQLCNQLKVAFNLTCANAATAAIELGNLTINCTDCHNNEVTGIVTTRGPVTESNLRTTDKVSAYNPSAEPVGPHGSSNKRILRANYNTRIGTARSSFAIGNLGALAQMDTNFALCFLCHDSTPFKNILEVQPGGDATPCLQSTDDIYGMPVNNCMWTNFYSTALAFWGNSLHYYHLSVGLSDNTYIKCHECHNNLHSNVEAVNTQYSGGASHIFTPDGNTHLINFGSNVKPDQYLKPAWYFETQRSEFQCNLKCHGISMTACSYKGEFDGLGGGAGVCF